MQYYVVTRFHKGEFDKVIAVFLARQEAQELIKDMGNTCFTFLLSQVKMKG